MEYADGGGGTTAPLSPLTYAVFGGFLVCFFMIETTRFDPVRYDDALMGIPPFYLSICLYLSPSTLLCFVCFLLSVFAIPLTSVFVVLLHYLTLKVSSCKAVL